VGRDDAIVQDVGDVRLRGQETEGGGVVLRSRGLNGGDAEVLVALDETSSGGDDAGGGVAGNGGVAIDDQVAMGRNAVGVDLCAGEAAAGERRDRESQEDSHDGAEREPAREERGRSGLGKGKIREKKHGCTS
jgi:hypothetical protein